MRAPALQTLLLYARSLDTNADCTRVLCDNWLEIRFLDAESAQKILSSILYLRSSIDKLFKIRLEDRLSVFDKEVDESGGIVELVERDKKEPVLTNFKERARKLEKLLKKN